MQIFTKLQTQLQNEERNDEKIVIIFQKTFFILSFHHTQVYYWQEMGARQLSSLVFSRAIFGVDISFVCKFQSFLDGFRFPLHKILKDILKQFGYCHYNFKHVYTVTCYFILSDVNYLTIVSFSYDTLLQKENMGKVY